MKHPSEVELIWGKPRIDAHKATFAGRNVGFLARVSRIDGQAKQSRGNGLSYCTRKMHIIKQVRDYIRHPRDNFSATYLGP